MANPTNLLHSGYRLTARAAFWSLVGPLALAALMPGTLTHALWVALAGVVPAAGACFLFLLAACSYALARDTLSRWRAPLTILACGSLLAGVLLWVGFFALVTA